MKDKLRGLGSISRGSIKPDGGLRLLPHPGSIVLPAEFTVAMHAEGCDRQTILFFIPLALCVRFTFVPRKFLPNFKFLAIAVRLNPYKESLSIHRFLVE
ncbi:MAG TPA: hypothetical protein DCY88_16000 [Cyanobacteria bacterium UBA11372]|nr:hypothetical protein [Cyanobacteria bacterium UBA11372]